MSIKNNIIDTGKKVFSETKDRITNISKQNYDKIKTIRDRQKAIEKRLTLFQIKGRYDFINKEQRIKLFVLEKQKEILFPVDGQLNLILKNAVLYDYAKDRHIKIIDIDTSEVVNFLIYGNEKDFFVQCYRGTFKEISTVEEIMENLSKSDIQSVRKGKESLSEQEYLDLVDKLDNIENKMTNIKTPLFGELKKHKNHSMELFPLVKRMIFDNQMTHPIIKEFYQSLLMIDVNLANEFYEIIEE